jgi:hypothetical protein
MRVAAAVASVWAILFAVPFVIYGTASAVIHLKPPAEPAWRFLLSVAVSKVGTALAFVLLFLLSRDAWRDRWLLYAVIWFVMFAVSEVADAIRPGYSATEAALGILSEAIYAPVAAFIVHRLFP